LLIEVRTPRPDQGVTSINEPYWLVNNIGQVRLIAS